LTDLLSHEINALGTKMQVTGRRAVLSDIDVVLELVNLAYKPEGRWKVEEKRTSLKELSLLIPAQDPDPETLNYQILWVILADDSENLSSLPEAASKSRIVGHIRYDPSLHAHSPSPVPQVANSSFCIISAEVQGSKAFFGMYAVWPQLHGKGLGRILLNELVKAIQETDSRLGRTPTTTLEASVASENTTLFPYYAKLGFELTGKEEPIPECFGPMQPGYEGTFFKYIARELKPFI
jgi:ribosomal protein S18 acetylase RimI-like enzyme